MKVLCVLAIAAAGLTAGCAGTRFPDPQPGVYQDYRSFAYDRTRISYWMKDVPTSVQMPWFQCKVDTAISEMKPDELQHWDAYARGELKITPDEADAYDATLNQRIDADGGLKVLMTKRCPDVVSEMDKYLI